MLELLIGKETVKFLAIFDHLSLRAYARSVLFVTSCEISRPPVRFNALTL